MPKSKYDNASRLVKTGDISQERFTEIQKVYQSRQAALEAARDEARTLVANVQALKDRGEARAKAAERCHSPRAVRWSRCKEKLISPGAYMKENTPILTLVKTDPAAPSRGTARDRRRLGADRNNADIHHRCRPGGNLHARSFANSIRRWMRNRAHFTAEARWPKSTLVCGPACSCRCSFVVAERRRSVVVPKEAVSR